MLINLNELENEQLFDKLVTFDDKYLKPSNLKDVSPAELKGRIYRDNDDTIKVDFHIKGKMTLIDSISLEDVKYDFSLDIDEFDEDFIKKDENTIDIMEVLWQNIVLEVPLSYTQVKDYTLYSGEGWKLVSEDQIKRNNPFTELMEKMEKE